MARGGCLKKSLRLKKKANRLKESTIVCKIPKSHGHVKKILPKVFVVKHSKCAIALRFADNFIRRHSHCINLYCLWDIMTEV